MSTARNAMLAKLAIGRKALAMAEDDYRAMLERVTGKASARDMSDGELDRVLTELKRLGFKPVAKRDFKSTAKPHARKIFALWTALDKAGALTDGSRTALFSFCERQTGVASPDWLTVKQANAVTEALKSWLARAEKERAA